MGARKGTPQTEAQKLASKENWQLFQLESCISRLSILYDIYDLDNLKYAANDLGYEVAAIKRIQKARKEARQLELPVKSINNSKAVPAAASTTSTVAQERVTFRSQTYRNKEI